MPTSLRPPPTNKPHGFSDEERGFLLTAIVYLGRPKLINKEFQDKFGKTVTKQTLLHMKTDPKNEHIFEEVRRSYERKFSNEYLSSKRRRVAAITEIYEYCMDAGALREAKDCVKTIDDMIENQKNKGTTIFAISQTNQYADITLPEIKAKKLELLKQLEAVKINKGELCDDIRARNEPNGLGRDETVDDSVHSGRTIETSVS